MKDTRRNFLKKGLAGAFALGSASFIQQPVVAASSNVSGATAKRI